MTDPAEMPARGEAGPRGRALRLGVQIAGFAIGVGLLWWCGTIALKPENRGALERLRDASPVQVLVLAALTVANVAINGALFRVSLRPVRRLPAGETQATNTVAMLLAYLPFKLSLLFRVFVHHRRHGVPLLTIGAWFAAMGAVMAAVAGPLLVVSLWRPRVDGAWLGGVLGGAATCVALLLLTARAMASERGWGVVERVWGALPAALAGRRALLDRAHEGVRMLAHPGAVLASASLRLAEAAVNAARFIVAAGIVAFPLGTDQGVLSGAVYALIGAAAPAGNLGSREAGTAEAMSRLLSVDRDGLMVVVLLVTAAEAAVLLVGAMASVAYLRPDRLLRGGRRRRGV